MKISELELINRIKENLVTAPVDLIRGVGEDCAVIRNGEGGVWLVTTDCLVEGVHFDLRYFSFLELGKKAMAVNLSDIAAMGGVPRYAFVTIAVPRRIDEGRIGDLYTGMQQVAAEFGVAIAGGDTSASPKTFFASLTLIGSAAADRYKLRSGARAGDGIYVSGTLGASALGLRLLQKKRAAGGEVYVRAHKTPRPRVALGQMLAACPAVHALIDVSDGLARDLGHVLEASGVAAEVNYEDLPREPDFEKHCRAARLVPEAAILAGGEDYQLLFTMDNAAWPELHKTLAAKRLKVTRIGRVVGREPGEATLKIVRGGKALYLEDYGYDHFA